MITGSPRRGRDQFFGSLGVTNLRTFVDPENPARVGLGMDVPDMEALMAAMETEAARLYSGSSSDSGSEGVARSAGISKRFRRTWVVNCSARRAVFSST
jgi:hypothetical protein